MNTQYFKPTALQWRACGQLGEAGVLGHGLHVILMLGADGSSGLVIHLLLVGQMLQTNGEATQVHLA